MAKITNIIPNIIFIIIPIFTIFLVFIIQFTNPTEVPAIKDIAQWPIPYNSIKQPISKLFFVDTIAVMPISTGLEHADINMAAIIPINKAPRQNNNE